MDRGLKLFACASAILLSSTIARGGDDMLIGTWKLKSFVRELSTGERYNELGEHPDGYLSYSSDGRMSAIIVADNQIKPRGETPTDEERIELHKTMIAYGGTYTIENGKVIHHIDIAWNGVRKGTDQVRFYTLDGDILTIKTAPNRSPVDGREGVGILEWEKVKASAQ